MGRSPGDALRHAARRGDVTEHHDAANRHTPSVHERGCRVFDGERRTVAPHKRHLLAVECAELLVPQRLGNPCRQGQHRALVNQAADLGQGFATGFGKAPLGQAFGHRVQVVDVLLQVSGDDCIADGLQRDARTLLLVENGIVQLAFSGIKYLCYKIPFTIFKH